MRRIEQDYSFEEKQKVGEGTYGIVYKAFDIRSGKFYALKRTSLLNDGEGVPCTSLREISLLKALNHPNIIKLHNAYFSSRCTSLTLVFEYVDHDLTSILDLLKPRPLPVPHVKSFIYQLLRALSYCHSHRVIHRDVKPQNILIQMNGVVKLADFGLARSASMVSRCYTHEIVTLWYRAPEILLSSKCYSAAVDIWSLGCVFAEMITQKPLFCADTEICLLFEIFGVLGTPTTEIWEDLNECRYYNAEFPKFKECKLEQRVVGLNSDGLDLLAQMLLYSQNKRISAKEALSHRYLQDTPIWIDPPLPKLLGNDGPENSSYEKLEIRT